MPWLVPLFRETVEDANWLHLDEAEQVRWHGRPSRLTLVPDATIMVLLVVLGIGLTLWARSFVADLAVPASIGYLPALIALVGIGVGIAAYLSWLRLLYVITDEEIYVKIGLVSRDITRVPFTRVQNTAYTQTVLERLLSYGTIRIYTAGTDTDDLVFEHVPNPERIMKTLSANVEYVGAGQEAQLAV